MAGLCQGKDKNSNNFESRIVTPLSEAEIEAQEKAAAEAARRKAEVLAKYPSLGGNSSSLVADNSKYHLPTRITDIDKERLEEEKAEHMGNARFKEVNGATYSHGTHVQGFVKRNASSISKVHRPSVSAY